MELGRVIAVEDETLEVEGLSCRVGDLLHVRVGQRTLAGLVVSFRAQKSRVILLDDSQGVGYGDTVYSTGAPPHFPTNLTLLGRALDPLGRPLDSGDLPAELPKAPLRVPHRVRVNVGKDEPREQFVTRIRAIDALIPVAKKQQILFVAGRGVGAETTLAMMARNSLADVVVTASVGGGALDCSEYRRELGEALTRAVTIHAPSYVPRSQQKLSLQSAVTLALALSAQGNHVLLLVNTLDQWLNAGGSESELNALLERLRGAEGEGVTGFFRLEASSEELLEVSPPARFDGRIVLSRKLATASIYPAVDPFLSYACRQLHEEALSRYGFWVKDILQRYRKNEDFIKTGAVLPGFSRLLDRSIEYYPAVRDFLRQGVYEKSELPTTLGRLKRLLAFV